MAAYISPENTFSRQAQEAAVQLITALAAHPQLTGPALQPLVGALAVVPLLAERAMQQGRVPTAQPRLTAVRLVVACPVTLPGEAVEPITPAAITLLRLNFLANLGYASQPAGRTPPSPAQLYLVNRPDGDVWLRVPPVPGQPASYWQGRAQQVVVAQKVPLGTAWLLTPLTAAPGSRAWLNLAGVGALCRRFKGLLLPLAGLSLGIQLMGLLVPVLTMVVYDRVIAGRAPVGYHTLITGLVLVLAFEVLLRHLRGRLLAWLGVRWDALAANLVVGQLLHLPAALIERAAVSSQLSRLRGFEVIRDVATSPIVLGLLDLPFVAVVLIALYAIGGALVWVPLVQLAVYGGLITLLTPWVKHTMASAAQTHEVRQRLMLETCCQLPALRADGLSEHWVGRLAEASAAAGVSGVTSNRMQHILEVAGQVSGSFAGLATLAVGIHLVLVGQLSAGALVASMMLVWRILAPLSLLCTALPRLIQLKQTLIQLQRLLELIPETPPLAAANLRQMDLSTTNPAASPAPHLQFHQVGLRYNPEHEPVLAGLSFTLHPGQFGVITGRNGSGKSTLLKLVLGLYPPQAGSIRLDGADLRQWQPEVLRQGIAYLPQQPELFAGTLASNLRLAAPLATDDTLWAALEQAGATAAVQQLGGLAAPANNLPLHLQYQLSLTRLFLRPAGLVLIDELPNAILGGPVGQVFRSWLAQQRGQRTILLVSHREDVMALADLAIGLRPEEPPLVGPPHLVQQAMLANSLPSSSPLAA